jgi:hypothetical protein
MNLSPHFLSRLYVIVLLTLVVSLSILQGRYTLDPHHWGLMLSNAKDLWFGNLPYQEIFIQYGILTTIIQAVAFGLSPHLLSGIAAAALCYAIGLWFVYRIAQHVLLYEKSALYLITGLVLFHPIAIYPWANYIAFPFLMAGLYGLLQSHYSSSINLLSGFSFGLSVLARETLAPAVCLLILFSAVYDLIYQKHTASLYRRIGCQIIGFLIPIMLFFLYLWHHHLYEYWKLLAIELPKIYAAESFTHIQNFFLKKVFDTLVGGVLRGEIRWILIMLMWLINLFIFLLAAIQMSNQSSNANLVKLSLATLLLISGSIHLADIFRVATSSVIGFVTVYAVLERKPQVVNYFFVITSIWLIATLGQNRWSGTNYFLPSKETLALAKPIDQPKLFRGSHWGPQAQQYYAHIEQDLVRLKDSNCGLKYQYNATRDSFFKVLSPFFQAQVAPYETSTRINQLRPDLNFERLIEEANKIVIFKMIAMNLVENFQVPEKFSIYSKYNVPWAWDMPEHQKLLILIPTSCKLILENGAQP